MFAAIRAGVVISASDLLRSVGLNHLAETLPAAPVRPELQRLKKSAVRPGQLTSSSSSYSLPISKETPTSPKPIARGTHGRQGSLAGASARKPSTSSSPSRSISEETKPTQIAVTCPSPSLSDASTTSSVNGGNSQVPLGKVFQNNEADNETAQMKECQNSAKNIMSLTPTSLDQLSSS